MCSLQIRSCSFPPITNSSPSSAWCALPHTHILFHSADNQGQNLEPQEKAFSLHRNCIFSLCLPEDSSIYRTELYFLCYSGILLSTFSPCEEEISITVLWILYSVNSAKCLCWVCLKSEGKNLSFFLFCARVCVCVLSLICYGFIY